MMLVHESAKKCGLAAVVFRKLNTKHCLIVGVDVSKKKNVAFYCTNRSEEVGRIRFANLAQGFRNFVRFLRHKAQELQVEQIIVGLEPTGPYSLPLAYYLDRQEDILLVGINPSLIKPLKALTRNSPEKSDEKDSEFITQLIRSGGIVSFKTSKGKYRKLRHWVRVRFQTVDFRTALLNQLESNVAAVFPELLGLFSRMNTSTFLALLKEYPTPQSVLELGLEKLEAFLRKHSRGQLGRDRAEAILEAARESVGLEDTEAYVVHIQEFLIPEIEKLNALIAFYDSRISELLSKIPLARYLLSMRGVGPIVAGTVLGEFDGFQNFRYMDQVLKFCGLNLCRRQSGRYVGEIKISKWGSPYVRRALYLAVMGMVTENGLFHPLYVHYLRRGKQRRKAMVILMRKLLRILFALVRDQAMFDEMRFYRSLTRLAA